MLEPNQIFAGRYRIVRHLADGGMGIIFEAEHLATEAHVALKLLWPHVMQVASARQRFELEAKVAARVNSEHIVRVLDAGFDPKTRAAYLVMELLLGSTLAASVKSHGPMSTGLTVALMRQVARGLDAAHGYRSAAGVLQPIVHRDLKPENLFLCARPEGLPLVKILDFGIAKVVRETANVSRDLRGTPAYMAYEQVAGEVLSPQTDVWALGLITYYALTGRAYWPSANQPTAGMQALFAEILTLPLPRASDRIREDGQAIDLPRAFDAWLFGCIARKPSQRFASAGEAIDALELVLRAPPEAAPAGQHALEAKRFTELAYATTAVLQGGAAWPTASQSVGGVASERSHLGGSPRRVVLVSVVVFALTLAGLAWHFTESDVNRAALTAAEGEPPAAPGVGSDLPPPETAVQSAQPAPTLVPPVAPPRADAGEASDGIRPVQPEGGPVVSPAPRAREVAPQPEPPTPPPEGPPRAPAPEPPPTPPVIPRPPPQEPLPDPPQPPPPSPEEPPDEEPPDEEPPDEEPPDEEPPDEEPPDEEPPDEEPPDEEPPDEEPPVEEPSEEPPAEEPCTFDPYTGRCSPSAPR